MLTTMKSQNDLTTVNHKSLSFIFQL